MIKPETDSIEDDEHGTFLAAVGRTVLTWQGVEEALVNVFVAVLQPTGERQKRAAQAALHAVMANSKAEAVDAAIHEGLEDFHALRERGEELIERFRRNAKDRNRIAHGVWVSDWTDFEAIERPDGGADIIGLNFENRVDAHPLRRRKGKAQPPSFDMERLQRSLDAFKRLEYDLSVFARDVGERSDSQQILQTTNPRPDPVQ